MQFQKISIPLPQKVSGNCKGEGGGKNKVVLKKSMELNWNFWRDGGYGYFLESHIDGKK